VDELNRDLLVVVLALLTGAIPRSGLNSALKAWTKDRRLSLAELLKKDGGLDADRMSALECLAAAHLKTHKNDLRVSLEAWNAAELTQDVLTEIEDDALRTTFNTTLGGSETVPAPEGSTASFVVGDETQTGQAAPAERFRLIRPHAKGGIGQVWVARDCELQRDVALKVIQDRFAQRQDQRARFVLEAEITGNLEHPGIVPVYSLGKNADGRPYYAMRFIRGESFAVAIRRFHKEWREKAASEGDRSRSQWGVEFRQLLGRFLDVCDAMDYAHSRDVLHRDLKPANIMLGRYGETLVVDWGLAKVLGRNDVIPAEADGEFEPSLAGASTVSGDTQPGMTIGTPSYMSPEQARGSIEELSRASDVYSLGATLYELLVGEVAFPGEKAGQVIEKVLKGDFRPPRAVYRSVPAPLNAICLKAMAAQPAERYASVRELAQDIEHWLADEPVTAYQERRLERVGRWLRQHRTWTYAAAASLVGVTLVATLAAVVIDRSRRREADARQEAQDNFAMAQHAVEEYLTDVSENILLQEQDSVDLRDLRKELLQKGLTYYERFVNQRGDDPLRRRELATAYLRVGDITQEIGSRHNAIAAYDSSRKIWESLAKANPGDAELQGRLADCYIAIGKLQTKIENFNSALKSLDRARTILEPLAASHPSAQAYEFSLAECYSGIGIAQSELKSDDQGLGMLQRAMAMQQSLLAQAPDNLAYQKSLAQMTNSLGTVYDKRNDLASALRSFQEVRDVCQSLLDRIETGPKPDMLVNLLALSLYNIGAIEWEDHHVEAALRAFEQSLAHRADLAAAHPSVTQYKQKLAESWRDIAIVQHRAKQDDKALASIQESLKIFKELVRLQDDQARFHSDLGKSWGTLGYIYDEKRQNQAAIPAFENAVAEQKRAIHLSEGSDEYRTSLYRDLENLGEQFLDLDQVDRALPFFDEAIKIHSRLREAHPENRTYAIELEQALIRLGIIQRQAGNSAAALDLFSKAEELAGPSQSSAPTEDTTLPARLATILTLKAAVLADQRELEMARGLLERAQTLVSARALSTGATAQDRESASGALWELARVLRELMKPAEAAHVDADRIRRWEKRPPAELVELTLKQLVRATVIGYGKTKAPPQIQAVRELELDQAADNLCQAILGGVSDLSTLQSLPDGALLLSREDVKSALAKRQSPGSRVRP
jgi:serine/threonine-protein kinase